MSNGPPRMANAANSGIPRPSPSWQQIANASNPDPPGPHMNNPYRKPLPGTTLDYFDAREAVNAIQPGAWDKLPYTSRVHAENIVRKAAPDIVEESLKQI